MDTSGLESFAQNLRTDLLSGVRQRLRYWGFKGDGTVEAEPQEVEGGYTFRGEVHDDPEVPTKWRALKNAVNRHGIDHVAEEAAYTWFNRLVAIRILEKNGHLTEMLEHAGDTRRPAVLDRAYDGIINVLGEEESEEIRQAILESDDDRAFRQLLVGVCHDNDLLNDVFGRLRDYTELLLPMALLDREGPVDRLVTTDAISDEDYEQVELIGWLYQFYISEKKDEVYDQSGKFQPEDIPAATQIFTPRWIVRYMVENTIGKQWLEKYPDSPLRDDMEYLVENAGSDDSPEPSPDRRRDDTEDAEVRENGGAGAQMKVFNQGENGDPTEPIFDDLSELELFDPAAGSGHILVVGFDLLMEMYRERGYTDREAVEQILTENLKGLEIDRRAAQLARFALLMKAAQYDRRALDRDDLRPEVYAMPEPRDFSTSDLRAYLGDGVFDAHGTEIKEALDLMTEHGQNVGSALKPNLSREARDAVAKRMSEWEEKTRAGAAQLDEQALNQEMREYLNPLLLLTSGYPAVAANPPYMGSGKMNSQLKSYLKEHYPRSKHDLSSVFIEVCQKNVQKSGRISMINQQSWMFLRSFEDLRSHVFGTTLIESMLHLGDSGLKGFSSSIVQPTAFVLRNNLSEKRTGTYFRLLNVENDRSQEEAFLGRNYRYIGVDQQDFKKIPGSPIAYWIPDRVKQAFSKLPRIEDMGETREGMITSNNARFVRRWYEVDSKRIGFCATSRSDTKNVRKKWFKYQKSPGKFKWYGRTNDVINWKNDGKELKNYKATNYNLDFIFDSAIVWNKITSNEFTARICGDGYLFDQSSTFLNLKNEERYLFILSLMNSCIVQYISSAMNPTLNYTPGNIGKIPVATPDNIDKFELLSGQAVEITEQDWSARETSWGFSQDPLIQQNTGSFEAAFGSWKQQSTTDFLRLLANEEELNELFIDLYGLENVEDELSPRVALDDITILKDELDRDALEELDEERDDLSDDELRQRFLEDDPDDALFKVEVPVRQFLSYGVGVMLGRYRLGHDGLHIAHPSPSDDELAPYEVPVPLSGQETTGTEQFEIDDDAIVPLMGRDSPFSDDAVHRMRDIVRLIWGEETLTENLNFINHAISVGRGRGLKRDYEKTMEEWLVGDFWDWHKSLYSVPYYGKKPIYWLFQSPGGHFQVLVYMHRMDKFTPQRIRQDYLQRYQQYLRREISELEQDGEETLSKDKADRLDTLRAAAEDCRAYDTILQEVAEQQIEIDLDDGVQNNYPKFGDAVADL